MTKMNHPIETYYRGHRFRSRIEARWAVFYDALDIEFQYEPEGFALPSGWYLPDFFIPHIKSWIEIKREKPDDKEHLGDRLGELAEATGQQVFVFVGDIYQHYHEALTFEGDGASVYIPGGWDNFRFWCECPKCHALGIQYSGASNRNCDCAPSWGDQGHDLDWPDGCRSAYSPRLVRAYERAMQERFAQK